MRESSALFSSIRSVKVSCISLPSLLRCNFASFELQSPQVVRFLFVGVLAEFEPHTVRFALSEKLD